MWGGVVVSVVWRGALWCPIHRGGETWRRLMALGRLGGTLAAGHAAGAPDGAVALVAGQFVLAGGVAVEQALYRLAVNEVRLYDLVGVFGPHAPVPDILWVDDHHWAVAALIEAAAMVDAHAAAESSLRHEALQARVHAEAIAIHRWAILAAGADEDVLLPDVPGFGGRLACVLVMALGSHLVPFR